MDSILISIKAMLGISKDYNAFDAVIVMHINSVFMNLNQIGVGPAKGFSIIDDADKWSDFISEDSQKFESVKSYVYLKVKLLFDPPLNSSIIESMKQQVNELEWRLNVAAEDNDREEENQNGQ